MSSVDTQTPNESLGDTSVETVASPSVEPTPATPASRRHARFPLDREPSAGRAFGKRFLRDLGRGIVVVLVLHLFVVQISVVRGLSMQPSLFDGDRLIVDRLTYSFGDVDRFDVVVLRNPRDKSVDYVKRVVGLPGETVEIHKGSVFVNGVELDERFEFIDDTTSMAEVIVPGGHYFVLGDNRPVSCDSREFGLVQHELLKGKVRMRFWPLTRMSMF